MDGIAPNPTDYLETTELHGNSRTLRLTLSDLGEGVNLDNLLIARCTRSGRMRV